MPPVKEWREKNADLSSGGAGRKIDVTDLKVVA
jgi:hypothetical protein